MAPPPKRKRPDRTNSYEDGRDGRPSPYRPQDLRAGMAHSQQQHHQNQQNSPRGGGPRRQSRNGGRGGSSVPQSPVNTSHNSPTAMSPPANSFHSNKPAPATPAAHAPPSNPPSTPTPAKDVPESNEYLTPQRVANWNGSARNAVVQAALSAQRDGDMLTLSVVFHEIIEAAIDRQLGATELGSLVREIVTSPSSADVDPVATFLDTLSSLTLDKDKQARVQQMLMATDIDISRMRDELEAELLGSLGLVRDTFGRVAVRKATHALYRQSNYNLLREETEGYSKLMTEYFTTVNKPLPPDAAKETLQRVNALIGAFDLDIGRVLDVTLDVFANLLVKHYSFFIKFLRVSAWWPQLRGFDGLEWEEPLVASLPQWALPGSLYRRDSQHNIDEQMQLREQRDRKFWARVGELGERAGIQAYFELGARRITANNRQPDQTMPADGQPISKQQAARKWADEWIAETGTLPPPSNDIAAQLLGFKLRFYASDARDAHDLLPDNLVYLAALLIKIGFISLLDLYPHLYPLEEDMEAHKEKLMAEKKAAAMEKESGEGNALTRAGALPDDAPPAPPAVSRLRERETASKSDSERNTPASTDEEKDKKSSLPEPADQKHLLLKSLLCIGALPEALFILGRHPWMLEVYPDLHEFLFRIAHHSVSKVYEATRPIPSDQFPVVPKGAGLRTNARPSDFIPRKTLRWAKLDQRDAGEGLNYKFYWEDWVDNVPVCQDAGDVLKLCTSFLGLLGAECGRDTLLLTKIVRIGKKSLADDDSSANRKRWIDFCATFIAPALSFTDKNPGITNEVWGLLKTFDTATRYMIYQQWFSSMRPTSLRDEFAQVLKSTNNLLGRVAAGNTKEYSKKIAKISYASPGIVFQRCVQRTINYANMIDTLVECVKYLTLLGYDCLTWTMVKFFINPSKEGTQDDGMLSAPWLKNIASFVGKVYQRHSFMDPTPVLQFVAHQVLQSEGELYMLDVLEQMIKSMGGISIYGTLSENMILSLSAGPGLRTFTFTHHLSDNRHQVGSSAKRLARHLKETGLASQILVALAQHLQGYVYREDQQDAPDKVVLFNLDKLRSNLLQYLELLRTYISVEEYDSLFPGVVEMMSAYGVEADIAFTVARASIAAKANKTRIRKPKSPTSRQSNGDVVMGDADGKPTTNGINSTPKDPEQNSTVAINADVADQSSTDVEMAEAHDSSDQLIGDPEPVVDSANPGIEALVKEMKTVLPDTFGQHPCLSFYVTFWQLSLPDVDTSGFRQQYQSVIEHWERQLPAPAPSGRRGYNSSVPRKETDQMRKAKIEIAKLKVEQQEVILANNLTQTHLRVEMQRWFEGVPMIGAQSDELHSALLQDCFLPRSRMSLQDAQFSAAILKYMHSSATPGFRTIKLLDLLFNANKLACIISMYSDEEALTFGRFINSILRELYTWHENKNDAYAKFALGSDRKLPGFGKKFDSDRIPTDHLQYDEFCKLLYKWHKSLFSALKVCLDTGDFQQIRNSLVILTACSGSFPKVDTMALELKQAIEPMAKHDERGDIKTTAGSSLALFRNPEKNFQSEFKFRNVPEPPKLSPTPVNGNSEGTPRKSATPQPQDNSSTKLKPTAPAFQPKTETNGNARGSTQRHEVDNQNRPTASPSTLPPSSRDWESARSNSRLQESRAATPSQQERDSVKPAAGTPVLSTSTVPPRPDGRNTPQGPPTGRPSHVLPTRPDPQPPRSRQPERPGSERPLDHGSHGRYEVRGPPGDYGRLDRSGDPARQREASPGRRGRPVPGGRTPERMPHAGDPRDWAARDARDYDERAMRAPPRDARAPPVRPPAWDPRDPRDPRDQRDRTDSRGHPVPPAMEPRRMPSNSALAHEHRRDMPSHSRHLSDRSDQGSSRLPSAAPSPSADGPTVNPARAALINQADHGRDEPSRNDREPRRDRGMRPQSPRGEDRRGENRHVDDRPLPPYHGRNDLPREPQDERGLPPPHSIGRDRREEPVASTPTGPRSGRNEPGSAAGTSREMFQPRSARSTAQDPNYGRLNQPADPAPPSGPRGSYNTPNVDTPSLSRSGERPHPQSQPPTPTPPSGPASSQAAGIHPSRLDNIQRDNIQRAPPGPALQTNMPNAPSGPRGTGRGPQNVLPSPVNRGPPTGPAANDRGPRGGDRRNPLGAINSVLTQNAPAPESGSNGRAPLPPQNPPVRGRGASRANGPVDATGGTSSPMPPPSHSSTPNARADPSQQRSGRGENQPSTPQDEGRSEPRGHRESRRSGRERSRSPDRSDRRPDERAARNVPPTEDRSGDRERGSGRDKRGSDREGGSRRDRGEREGGERPPRESGGSRESRDNGSRRERSSRDEGGRPREDRRSRGGGSADDGRKRVRDPQDQGQGHGDTKRRR
ncbi:THO complex subunit 2 [Parastagonospora nodorum]|uniref:THO complex subunit 2 n=1 Tax=Phaeosphaeria nodorum (strain SN15 / ATCC MYA-4574 / FGSC 10173) TaxID=321614 RepID=A0A7U2F8R0_PHANO|nr:THO complex subunit 2 [Parastagonospora nodorum]QRD00833.1 THO complex subunit 2 [Parastagonospora nodorum SN15]KAH3925680.1 THO complex subunit 2 [Parastagonospora nodorum]KAH4132337.1 THO complex subunit 2 [Parastagonospora nodorum]KAH4150182.1 THO complex subunit 2 [Parastagonospora nodorum]